MIVSHNTAPLVYCDVFEQNEKSFKKWREEEDEKSRFTLDAVTFEFLIPLHNFPY